MIFLVAYVDYDRYDIYGAFSTRELAEEFRGNFKSEFQYGPRPGDLYIAEVPLNPTEQPEGV